MQPLENPTSDTGFRKSDLRQTALETTLALGGLALFMALLYQMRSFLTPPLIAGALLVLLWPLRGRRAVHALLLSSGFIFFIWVSYTLSVFLIPFGIVFLVAYLFNPVVTHVHLHWRVARWLSSLIVTFLMVSTIALLGLFLVPTILDQFEMLITRTTQSVQDLQNWILTTPVLDKLTAFGVERDVLAEELVGAIQGQMVGWTTGAPSGLKNLFVSIKPVFTAITITIVTPVILFYTLKDYASIKTGLVRLMPKFNGRRVYIKRIGGVIGNYLRGQLTISAIASIIISAALMIAQVPFALLIGIMAGLLNMIPSLGIIITNILAISIALIFGERGIVDVILVISIIMGESLLEQAILMPKILSHQVGVHPVVILLSILIFGYFFGFLGLFIAVPTTALAQRLLDEYQEELTLDLNFHIALQRSQSEPGMMPVDLALAEDVTEPPESRTKENGTPVLP